VLKNFTFPFILVPRIVVLLDLYHKTHRGLLSVCYFSDELAKFLSQNAFNEKMAKKGDMMKKGDRTIHFIAATIFTIVTFVHTIRLAFGWPLVIGNWAAPMWISWLAVFLAGTMTVLMWRYAVD